MAITTTDIVNKKLYESTINTNIVYEFIKDTIDILGDNKGYLFLLDNAPIHKSETIKKLIIDNGHFLIYSPPYSPNNNPVEYSFSSIKHHYKNIRSNVPIIEKSNITLIKQHIYDAIDIFYNKCKNKLISFFNRALTYTYKIEEKQLRDRIAII
jgi:transposase